MEMVFQPSIKIVWD